MVDLDYLEERGVSSEAWKLVFTREYADQPDEVKRLLGLISSRINDGYTSCFSNWRAIAAIDFAYDTPFCQTTATLVHHILDKRLSLEDTMKALKDWGLSENELFMKVTGPDNKQTWKLNVPLLFNVFIPIVKSYTEARLARIFNEINLDPLFPCQPLHMTDKDRVRAEVWTDIFQTQSTWFGYPAVLRQQIQQMLKYGVALGFTREEWYCEKQVLAEAEGYKTVTDKEGLRYTFPHPTKMAWDLTYPLWTINSDTGIQWLLWWHLLKYGEILDSQDFWNREKIFVGTNWFNQPMVGNYFTEIFPCRMDVPVCPVGPNNREDAAAWYNTSTDRDKAVFVTEIPMKIIPKKFGLGDYNHPIWANFTIAGSDTVLWARPCAYTPATFMGYLYDDMCARTSSFALECIPWQDSLGNALTQMNLTARQNLMSVTFYDENIVNKQDILDIANKGEDKYRGPLFIGFDSQMASKSLTSIQQAFFPVPLQKQTIDEFLKIISSTLNIMERVLGITAQEVGAAASHQQSKAEVQQTSGASENRIVLISSSVLEGKDAMRRQLYDADLAYMDAQFVAEISSNIKDIDKIVGELGFEIKGRSEDRNTIVLEGHKKKLRLEGFATSSQSPAREKNGELSQIIFQTVGTIAGQSALFAKIGAKNLIRLIEKAAQFAGAPPEFELPIETEGKSDEQIQPQIIEAIKAAQQATMQAIETKLGQPIAKEISDDRKQIAELQSAVKQLAPIATAAKSITDKNAIAQQELQADEAIAQAEFAAEQKRKDAALAADIARKDAEARAKIQRDHLAAHSDVVVEHAKTAAQLERDQAAHKQAMDLKSQEAENKPEPAAV